MSYPSDWDYNDIHWYETGEVICPACENYIHESLLQDSLCPDCFEENEETENQIILNLNL